MVKSDNHRIYSPCVDNKFGYPRTMWLRKREDEKLPGLHLYPTDEEPLDPHALKLVRVSMILPILGERGCWRYGLRIHDYAGEKIATFMPAAPSDKFWPDWRAPLEARGLALLVKGDVGDAATSVTMHKNKPDDADPEQDQNKIGWLNPIAIAFRDKPIPGILGMIDVNRDGNGLGGTPILKAIDKGGARSALIAKPDVETMRRAIGWSALFAERPGIRERRSALEDLFDPKRGSKLGDRNPFGSNALWNLAALDAMGGTFVADWDGEKKQICWSWAPPDDKTNVEASPDDKTNVEASEAALQHAKWLAQQLGLGPIEKAMPTIYKVSSPGRAAAPPFADIKLKDGNAEDRLQALATLLDDCPNTEPVAIVIDSSELQALATLLDDCPGAAPPALWAAGAAPPVLWLLAKALAAEAGRLIPDEVSEVFQPLKDGFVKHKKDGFVKHKKDGFVKHKKDAGQQVDWARFFNAIGRFFLKPQSPVLVRLDAVKRADGVDAAPDWNEFATRAVDLFDDPLKTAQLVFDADAAAPEAIRRYDRVWPSLYREHLVGGNAAVQFELTLDPKHFLLDVSHLDEERSSI